MMAISLTKIRFVNIVLLFVNNVIHLFYVENVLINTIFRTPIVNDIVIQGSEPIIIFVKVVWFKIALNVNSTNKTAPIVKKVLFFKKVSVKISVKRI